MLELDAAVGPGALCDAPGEALQSDLAGLNATWWHGTEAQFVTDPKTGAITEWQPVLGTQAAIPTNPNTGNGLVGAAGDVEGLQCREGVHCGLVADNITKSADTCTIALRYLPPHDGDARTVLTLNAAIKDRKNGNYLYLSEANGELLVHDNADQVELRLPAPKPDTPRLVCVSLAGERVALRLSAQQVAEAEARAPILKGTASLFIGCRSHRSGLLKTLGAALISDVWILPGCAMLLSNTPEDRRARMAFERFDLWSGEG